MTSSHDPVQMIHTRRNKLREHTDEEIEWWIASYCRGSIEEYQMSAWLMAVCFNPLSSRETATLTRSMVQSGVRLDWSHLATKQALVDKHSTGGVGDKVSIILAPLVACLGVGVPMMAGRGLGHTGGTIDKLESIVGYRTDLSVDEFQQIVRTVGCAITTTGPDLCPADKKLYALRDVTSTVSSIPLQTASIMCKKIAENPQSLVLDVKYGRGAFQATADDAIELAVSMVSTGQANGLMPTTAFLTRMDHPIGCAVGNWLEVKECIDIMRAGQGSRDLIELVLMQAGQMLLQSGVFPDSSFEDCVNKAQDALEEGKALTKFREMVVAQGGNVSVVDNAEQYPTAEHSGQVLAQRNGFVAHMDALVVGDVSVQLGAGRRVANAPVNMRAGILLHYTVGDSVTKGDAIATVYTDLGDMMDEAIHRLQSCIEYSDEPLIRLPMVTHRVSSTGTKAVAVPARLSK
jgi:pyrimidine-nucleoside phosphorylase